MPIRRLSAHIQGSSSVVANLQVRTALWVRWAAIAIVHAREARAARAALETEERAPGEGFDLPREQTPAMIAVSAAAHAIDGLYGDVQEYIVVPQKTLDAWNHNVAPRRTRILETLKLGFSIGPKTRSWATEFKWLFDLRDAALHHGPAFRESVPHPLGVNVTREYVDYSVESAERAVRLMRDVLASCIDSPKPATREWAARMGGVAAQLTE